MRLLKLYSRPQVGDPLGEPCSGVLRSLNERDRWKRGLLEFLGGSLERADEDLSAALAGESGKVHARMLDQLLTFAPVAWRNGPERADFAVAFARRHLHTSPIGYIRLARAYLAQISAGDTTNWDRAKIALRLAGETEAEGLSAKIGRAEAWFRLGELSKDSDQSAALTAYQAVIAEDAEDYSWGYAWMAAMQIVEINVQQVRWADALTMLGYAASLPDRYHRYSYTRLRLAQLLAEWDQRDQAIATLEEAIEHDRDFVPTRLDLARLYRMAGRPEDAVRQYREVVSLDQTQQEARSALAELGGSQ